MGLCSQREIEIVNRWFDSIDLEETDGSFHEREQLPHLGDEMFEEISNRIDESWGAATTGNADAPVREMPFWNMQNLRRIAAISVLTVLAVVFFYSQQERPTATPVAIEEIAESQPPGAVYLSDGSVVWLKGKSTLDFPKTFTGGTREVRLTGEAFFEIAKDPERPFIIHSANLTTRVLGTSFNIKDYKELESMEVAVVTGKVSVSANAGVREGPSEIILTPYQKATYSKEKKFIVETESREIKTYQSLAKTKLIFKEAPLQDILFLLNDTYDVNIRLGNDAMARCMITADLTGEPLMVSLKILSKAIGAEYEIKGRDIVLRGSGCRPV